MNLRRVDEHLIRSDQPNNEAWAVLAALVDVVVSLRKPGAPGDESIFDLQAEEDAALAAGVQEVIHIPVGGGPLDAPTRDEVFQFLSFATSGKRVLVHCLHGSDRTGVFVACYRMTVLGWDKRAAIAEAKACGMSPFELRMHEFLEDYVP